MTISTFWTKIGLLILRVNLLVLKCPKTLHSVLCLLQFFIGLVDYFVFLDMISPKTVAQCENPAYFKTNQTKKCFSRIPRDATISILF